MANEENLKPKLFQKGEERAKRLGRKGGKVKSLAKKKAAKLRDLKKKGKQDEIARFLAEMIESPNASSIDILKDLLSIKKTVVSPRHQIDLAQTRIQWHKAHHGEKIKKESHNVNVNLNVDMAKFKKLIEEYDDAE